MADFSQQKTEAVIHVAPSPHIFNIETTTRSMMRDVLIALLPVLFTALYIFRWSAAKQIVICLAACLAGEAMFTRMRQRPLALWDLSAAVTGVILGLSLPAPAPWYIGIIASFVAVGIGKMVFGGLGMNIFNPAMVGRAFVMIAFADKMAAGGYVDPDRAVDVMTQATPLTAFQQAGTPIELSDLFWGLSNGSIGEISAAACLIGGGYLLVRRVASWQIPAAVLATVFVLAGGANLMNLNSSWTVWHHFFSGALLFGAFFIATDPVTSPLTGRGKWIFGIGVGVLVMLIRTFSGYPEGVMFAVLLMNACTPLINRWTRPRPFGSW